MPLDDDFGAGEKDSDDENESLASEFEDDDEPIGRSNVVGAGQKRLFG